MEYRCYDYWVDAARQLGFETPDQAIAILYQSHSLDQVGKLLGVSGRQIGNRLAAMNIPRRPRGGCNNHHIKLKI